MARFVIVVYSATYPGIRRVIRKQFDDTERASVYAQNLVAAHRKKFRVAGLAFDRWAMFHVKPSAALIECASGSDNSQRSTKDKASSTKEARRRRIGIGGTVTGTRSRAIRVGAQKTPRMNPYLARALDEAKQRRADNGSIWPVGGNPNGQK